MQGTVALTKPMLVLDRKQWLGMAFSYERPYVRTRRTDGSHVHRYKKDCQFELRVQSLTGAVR